MFSCGHQENPHIAGKNSRFGLWRRAVLQPLADCISGKQVHLAAVMWILSPVVTALGYALGIVLGERLTKASPTRFDRILIWPLIGCAIGAGIVVWFGPMLIVFGMFLLGTASVILREWSMRREKRRASV
jgi:hypothetical protein